VELIGALRMLRRRRVLVALGVLAAVAAGLAVERRLDSGAAAAQEPMVAETRLFVDTPTPLAVDVEADTETIGAHAALLADLMAAEPQVRAIARGAGVAVGDLAVLRPVLTAPAERGQLAERTAEAPPSRPYTLKVTASVALPIVSLEAGAPDADVAARLAQAGTEALESLAAAKGPTPGRRLVVEPLEPVTVAEPEAGGAPASLLGLAAAFVTFVVWCVAVVLAGGVVRGLRRPAAARAG
jgi:hypothetical protein